MKARGNIHMSMTYVCAHCLYAGGTPLSHDEVADVIEATCPKCGTMLHVNIVNYKEVAHA